MWQHTAIVDIKALGVEAWLQKLRKKSGLSFTTLHHIKQTMALVFKFGDKHELTPENFNPMRKVSVNTESEYEATTVSPDQAFDIYSELQPPESTLLLLIAITGLRMGEALGLRWSDIDWANEQIQVRRSWTLGRIGKPKSHASRAAVSCMPALAAPLQEWRKLSPYNGDDDWVFPSFVRDGKIPRCGSTLVTDYFHTAARRAGVLKEGDKQVWGAHCLRHSLSSFLCAEGVDIKTVQDTLRHADASTTLDIYTHGRKTARDAAQNKVLSAFFEKKNKPITVEHG
jgi:integrase